jgi:hypothetical protein
MIPDGFLYKRSRRPLNITINPVLPNFLEIQREEFVFGVISNNQSGIVA